MAAEQDTAKVDETTISPVERRNSLEKHLQLRPDAQDLKNRNILMDTNAAPYELFTREMRILKHLMDFRSLQAKQLELERQKATDSLRKGLEKRPDREELIERR